MSHLYGVLNDFMLFIYFGVATWTHDFVQFHRNLCACMGPLLGEGLWRKKKRQAAWKGETSCMHSNISMSNIEEDSLQSNGLHYFSLKLTKCSFFSNSPRYILQNPK